MRHTAAEVIACAKARGPAKYYCDMIESATEAARAGNLARALSALEIAQATMKAFGLVPVAHRCPPDLAIVRPGLTQEMADPSAGVSRGRP